MEINALLVDDLENAHRFLGIAMEDLTDETANWHAGDSANTIASLLAHVATVEDAFINRIIRGGETIYARDGWSAKTGLPELAPGPPGIRAIWDQTWQLQLRPFDEYAKPWRLARSST